MTYLALLLSQKSQKFEIGFTRPKLKGVGSAVFILETLGTIHLLAIF